MSRAMYECYVIYGAPLPPIPGPRTRRTYDHRFREHMVWPRALGHDLAIPMHYKTDVVTIKELAGISGSSAIFDFHR